MLATVITAAILLQQQHEAALAGRVIDANGHAAARATVTLLHRPIPRHFDPAHEHRVVVATDEHGAFRASLHDNAVYSVWAATAGGASSIAEGVSSGEFLELRIEPDSGPRTVEVSGLDAWQEAATFRWRALVGGEHLDFVSVECRDGKLALPPLPPIDQQVLEVLRADGEVLYATCATDDDPMGAVQLPPPATYTVHVNDAAGAPLRDVEMLVHLCNYWATTSCGVHFGDRFRALWPVAGRTDGNGALTLRIADPGQELWLLAKKDGFRLSLDGVHDGKHFRGGNELPAEAQPKAADAITIVLEAAPPQKLSLRAPGGAPAAVDTLFVVSRVWVHSGASGSGTPFMFALPLADGEAGLATPLPATTDAERVCGTLAPASRTAVGELLGYAPPALFLLPEPKGLVAGGVDTPTDASAWRSLRVVAADGRPAARTVVQLCEKVGEPGTLLRTDRLGRIAFPVTADLQATVFAPEGASSVTIAKSGERTTTLALRALVPLTGRVLDAAGAPVAGARVSLQVRVTSEESRVMAEHLTLARHLAARTGDDGRFELLAPPDAAQLTVIAAAAHQRGETTIEWDPAAPGKIEITVEAK